MPHHCCSLTAFEFVTHMTMVLAVLWFSSLSQWCLCPSLGKEQTVFGLYLFKHHLSNTLQLLCMPITVFKCAIKYKIIIWHMEKVSSCVFIFIMFMQAVTTHTSVSMTSMTLIKWKENVEIITALSNTSVVSHTTTVQKVLSEIKKVQKWRLILLLIQDWASSSYTFII